MYSVLTININHTMPAQLPWLPFLVQT